MIDTSRNGNGPYTEGDPEENWCNPPGRALGEAPDDETRRAGLVDAYVWVKRPGESDGTCKGGPKAGRRWYPELREGRTLGARGWVRARLRRGHQPWRTRPHPAPDHWTRTRHASRGSATAPPPTAPSDGVP